MSQKISQLPSVIAANISDTDILPLVATNITSKVTVANLRTKLGTTPPLGGRTVTDAFTYLTNNAVFNVKDYGAFGDGVTNDTTAIQNAITQAAINGGIVLLPVGNYKTTATLTVPVKVSIRGMGGEVSIIKPNAVDGIALNIGADFNSVFFEDFGILGTGCSACTAFKSMGDATNTNWTSGVRISGLRIGDVKTGMRLRNLHRSVIRENWFQRVDIGIDYEGQNMVNWIVYNWIIYAGGVGGATKKGIIINSTSDYNPGGVTQYRPESVHVDHNQVFGFDYGIQVLFALFVDLNNNDIAALVKGIEVTTVNAVLNIKDNYIEVDGATGTHGLHLQQTGVIDSIYNIENNNFIATASTSGIGIEFGNFGVAGGVTNVKIIRNAFTGWAAYDISAYASGDTQIIGNHCYSTLSTSILVRGTIAFRPFTIDQNRCIGNISIPSANTPDSQVMIGANFGTFSTLIRGTITIANGTTTTTVNYSALGASTKNFDTLANTGLKQQVTFGAPSSNVGAVWGSASATALTVNCSVASVGATTVPFEVRSIINAL